MGCGESKEKNKIAPDKEDDITPKIYLHNETIEDISVPSSQVPSTSTESSEKRHGNSIFLFDQKSATFCQNSAHSHSWRICFFWEETLKSQVLSISLISKKKKVI